MAEAVVIRPERDPDHPAIADVVRAAFVDHPDEVATFVERLRASEEFIPELALVAEDSSRVIAHVILSWVGVEGGSRDRILNLTPMSVRPDRQRVGVGSRLIRDAPRRRIASKLVPLPTGPSRASAGVRGRRRVCFGSAPLARLHPGRVNNVHGDRNSESEAT